MPHEFDSQWAVRTVRPALVLVAESRTAFAEAALACRNRDAAAILYPKLAPFSSLVVNLVFWVFGPVASPLCGLAALLDRYDEAEDHFQTACEVGERRQHPYPAGRVRLHQGRALLERSVTRDLDRRGIAAPLQRRVGTVLSQSR